MVAWLFFIFILTHLTASIERCRAFSHYDSTSIFKRVGSAPLLLPRTTGITHATSGGGDSTGVSFMIDFNEEDIHSRVTTTPTSLMMMDPLVSQILQSVSDDDNPQPVLSVLDFGSLRNASLGISVWRTTLLKGRLPTSQDFFSSSNANLMWPPEPLFRVLCKAMAALEFPRFVLTHPEMITPVLRSLLQMTTKFARQQQQQKSESNEDDEEEDDDDDDFSNDFNTVLQDYIDDEWMQEDMDYTLEASDEELVEQLAIEIVAQGLTEQWGGVIRGVRSLDQLFGMNHGLLQDDNNNLDNNIERFGRDDGVWKHSGWQLIPELQQQISSMPELKDLIQSLGRRPTAEQSNAMDKFIPRRLDEQGALGAQYDPTRRSSIRGITLSGSLSEMLPSEAMLLVQRRPIQEEANNISQIIPSPPQSALRRLFLAKMVESKLLSYESSGWQDVPSTTVPKPRYLTRLPSAPGGPILICLDTSWSMTGRREQLSKAVVLACVAAAHKQKRDIQIVAFSSARNVMEAGPITADARGVRRLLEFLSSSFGGGTDVTGALKHAMTTISTETKPEKNPTGDSNGSPMKASRRVQEIYNKDINSMAAADILLVTDGEIPDPPVSEEMMEALDWLKQKAGVQVHGLLVGKRESVPLVKLCTQIHDFLIGYDALIPTATRTSAATATASTGIASFRRSRLLERSMAHLGCRRRDARYHFGFSVASLRRGIHTWNIQAKFSDLDDNDDWGDGRGRRQDRSGRKKKNFDKFDQYDGLITDSFDAGDNIETTTIDPLSESSGAFSVRVKEAEDSLRASVREFLRNQKWTATSLDEEKQSEDSCWQYRGQLQKAAERIAHGLVEREEEARLVVLGMVAQEHVLFLGPPGTAKSVLGRRLSQLCGGTFFQRLLTRFTTPEEIFGPLSLRALENDEYRRKTDGFLPTATVAFLDEIFKANSAILNTLLTILNERQFDNGAGLREECPIRCVVGASNELPESDELDALYDRFLLRKEVLPVSDEGIMQMLGMPLPGVSPCDGSDTDQDGICNTVFTDDLDKLICAISAAADTVVMENEAIALLRDLRTFMREDLGVDVSDRRLVKATRLLKISAACHGRKRVDSLDCLLLQHIIWRLPEQKTALKAWLWSCITPGSSGLASVTLQDESLESAAFSSVQQFRILLDGVRQEAIAAARKSSGDVTGDKGGKTPDIEIIRSLCQEAGHIATLLQRRSDELERYSELLRRSQDHLWLDPNEALSAQQLLLPRAEAYLKEANRALEDARALEKSLSAGNHLANDIRLSVIQLLWDDNEGKGLTFSPEALEMSIKEAKAKYDQETFRSWKRARKRYEK